MVGSVFEASLPYYKKRRAEAPFEDDKAIGRVAVLLQLLKTAYPKEFGKYEVLSADKPEDSRLPYQGDLPTYVVRKVGWLGSKPIPGFTRGRMVRVEKQLREVFEQKVGRSVSDEELDKIVSKIAMSPITSKL